MSLLMALMLKNITLPIQEASSLGLCGQETFSKRPYGRSLNLNLKNSDLGCMEVFHQSSIPDLKFGSASSVNSRENLETNNHESPSSADQFNSNPSSVTKIVGGSYTKASGIYTVRDMLLHIAM
ncbi:hypothetical protein POM88_036213 [Heracleum sosnowskyi]|uniref:Uncharacterized protein n=1 Tax=Heracleum sosnowskyi TaxID=360622 RepID=A0AAD8HNV9_9APIA|nr:hypothetical protein POM88_036213 [Heracleum sosnowskyi]